MVAEFPGFTIWTDAYLADTTHLTTIEHGAFLLLLLTTWRSKTYDLPDDDRLLARYARLTTAQWRRIRPTLELLWRVENGRWSNDRLLDELDAVRRNRSQRSDAGKASALKRLHRGSTVVGTDVQRKSNTPSPSPYREESIGNTESEIEAPSPIGEIAVSRAKVPRAGNGHHDHVGEAISLWNAFAAEHGLAQCQRRTKTRTAAITRRLAEAGGIEGWQAALDRAASIEWMFGQNQRGWRINLDSLIREGFFTKLMEGAYDNATPQSQADLWLDKQGNAQ